jgi:NAD(P)H-hydrate epimerase
VGQALEPGVSLCGRLSVAEIGLPKIHSLPPSEPLVWLLEEADARERVPVRMADSHKGTYGHVLVIAGSWGKTGAAVLAGLGALRAGAGLVSIATRPQALAPMLSQAPEVMGVPLDSEGPLGLQDLEALTSAAQGKRAIVLGPGIPVGRETAGTIVALLRRAAIPCVLDADGLNALSGDVSEIRDLGAPVILTPHPGEMARLLRCSTADVLRDRIASARTLAAKTNGVAVLKGARTIIATPDGSAYVNPTGNPGMATGGSGDVLSGICGGLLAQGLAPVDAAISGVFAHGLAGDLIADQTGQAGLIASDLFQGLQKVWVRWRR